MGPLKEMPGAGSAPVTRRTAVEWGLVTALASVTGCTSGSGGSGPAAPARSGSLPSAPSRSSPAASAASGTTSVPSRWVPLRGAVQPQVKLTATRALEAAGSTPRLRARTPQDHLHLGFHG